ncbi:MAG: aminotransferase class I/II-fold pyridoxal phosphate-dependent enzyme [Pseudomonadales bacterium]|nr:aminotransferase class I/II-fold pyridoxal phosphate-dependent enzyme [Pseudomonadales bacterium]
MSNLYAPRVRQQPVSVTRKMAASLPGLRAAAERNGLRIHHLGAGYPHPEVTDPRGFLEHQARYFAHLDAQEGRNDPTALPEYLREMYSYTDTLGPRAARAAFAGAYGNDWGIRLNPDRLIPTVGATGGIHLACSLFEHAGEPVAYITDAPTYAGFTARADLCQHARIYSVEMDTEGADPDGLRRQIRQARADGYFVPFYYTIPDGHNPAGFSFSQRRRLEILTVLREEGVLILEDAPYVYISFAAAGHRPTPFVALAPEQTIHLFTGSKIGYPGPRVGFVYSEAMLTIEGGRQVAFTDLALTEAAAAILFQNPAALRGFEALMHDADFQPRASLWPLADEKLAVYRENRTLLLDGLNAGLGDSPDRFRWTVPEAGFFSVFTFLDEHVRTDEAFTEALVAKYGVVAIPMADFYPRDARQRNPRAGLDQLRLSFCFSESVGDDRRRDLTEAVAAFCRAAKAVG